MSLDIKFSRSAAGEEGEKWMKNQPCPACGLPAYESEYTYNVWCTDESCECPLSLDELEMNRDIWNRLSLAVHSADARMEYNNCMSAHGWKSPKTIDAGIRANQADVNYAAVRQKGVTK